MLSLHHPSVSCKRTNCNKINWVRESHFRRFSPNTARNGSLRSLNTWLTSLTFWLVRPPSPLPIPPCRRWTFCLPLPGLVWIKRHVQFVSCFLLYSSQCRQILLEIRTLPQWHTVRTLLAPSLLRVEVFLYYQMVSVIFIRKSIPSSTNFFMSMILNHPNTAFLIF